MTTPTDPDAAQRHRALRQQFIAQEREGYDGHGRRPGGQVSKAELRRRRQRRRSNARLRDQATRAS